jgi:peptidoglycan/LPS O-acetylase OafA/YrhL
MIGLFQHVASSERPWVRYLSDASYWMYLAHLPLVLAAQLLVRDWPLPPVPKFLFVCTSVFIILLATYHFLVRYSWIGALLNSRKSRHSPVPHS